MKKFMISALSFALISLTPIPAHAVFGGTLALGDQRVVTYFTGQGSNGPGCTGTLIAPQIVVTVAHCMGPNGQYFPNEVIYPNDFWVALPGADIHSDDFSSRVRVMEALLTAGYDNTWDPAHGNTNTTINDVAFLLLDKPIVSSYSIPIATQADLALIKSSQMMMTEIGYGLQDQGYFDGKPYLATLQAMTTASRITDRVPYETMTIATVETGAVAMCPGDSGSPYFATVNGVEKLVAVMTGSSGCRGPGTGTGGTSGTLIEPYLPLLQSHWDEFLTNLPTLRQNLQGTDPTLSVIQVPFGCHPWTSSVLQIYTGGEWVDYMPAQGWTLIEGCPRGNPYQAWVRANVATSTIIRWHIWSGDAWSWTSPPESYVNPKFSDPPTPIERFVIDPVIVTDPGGVPVPPETPVALPNTGTTTPVPATLPAPKPTPTEPARKKAKPSKCLALKLENQNNCRNKEEEEGRE